MRFRSAVTGCLAAVALLSGAAAGQEIDSVGTALVLAVDVSGSVNADRFGLQMEGIASAFEDPQVQRTILAGRRGAMLVTLINWSNKPMVSIPWTLIGDANGAMAFAAAVRGAERAAGEFTCMAAMLQLLEDKVLPLMPVPADRTVVDVSGDGRDNCNPPRPVAMLRDQLVAGGVTINGLPILEGEEAALLEPWYEANVIGGELAFLMPANGYEDFARAIRQKFITEISGNHRDRSGLALAVGIPARQGLHE